jgi:hypothetical protein
MKSRFAILCLILALAARTRAAVEPLADGEQLTYGVSFAIIPGAGRITVTAHSSIDSEGRPFLRVITETETRGLAHVLLPFNAHAESLYDAASGHLVWFGESSSTRGKDASHSIDFDYVRHTAEYTDSAKSEDPRTIALPPPGEPSDLVNCLLQARYWNLVPGQSRDVLVFFEDDFYPLTIHALRYEDVDTGVGSGRALLLEPRMEKVPPKGMFKRGETVKVWIGQDARRLPLQFEVQFKIGSGIATLSAYRPGAAAAGGTAAPAPADRK